MNPSDGTTDLIVAMRSRVGAASCWLEIGYNGASPPRALFADLEMIGWKPPTLVPPPKWAIDWTVPNRATGAAFSVADYWVDSAVVDPPTGGGPRGSWTAEERVAFLVPLEGVLRRHGIPIPELPPNLTDAPTAPPGGRRAGRGGGRFAGRAGGRRSSRSESGSPPVTHEQPSSNRSVRIPAIPPGGAVLIRVVVPPTVVTEIESAVRNLDVTMSSAPEEHESTQTFRGATTSSTSRRYRLTILARGTSGQSVANVLAGYGVPPELFVLNATEAANAAALAGGAPAAAALPSQTVDDTSEFAAVVQNRPCIHLVVDVPIAASVSHRIDELGLKYWRQSWTQLVAVGSFRGSRQETVRRAVEFELWVPEPHLRRVIGELTHIASVDPAQTDRVWVTTGP
jgi:hypothetical protein